VAKIQIQDDSPEPGLLCLVILLSVRTEDNALLIGAITGFVAVAATMYVTRKVDWCSSSSTPHAGQRQIIS